MDQSRLIPVLCDMCRVEGLLGQDDFEELGAMLDFDPVPRKRERVDGWNAETQRAFIAALAATGSFRRAAGAVGRAPFGAEQLRRAEGGEGFDRACEEALAHAREMARRRRDAGVGAVARDAERLKPMPHAWSHAAARRPAALRPSAPDEETPEDDAAFEARWDMFCDIARKYALKVTAERECRLAGKVVEADFYLRQLTALEVMLDLLSMGHGMKVLAEFRARQDSLLTVAETELSRLLGAVRREMWEDAGEPERPEHPPRRYLVAEGMHSTEPLEFIRGGPDADRKAQEQEFEDRHRRDAEAQLEWEARAYRDFANRRDSAT